MQQQEAPLDMAWFVGASFSEGGEQTARFTKEGMWEVNRPTAREKELVLAMRPGDRIAIKSSYVKKHGLPFDNRQNPVSVMAIKATGVITENPLDGEHVKVRWQPVEEPREWYFYTYRSTIWRVRAGDWSADGLLAFAFRRQPQDMERFRNDPFWKSRYGAEFPWTAFYEAMAEALLRHADDRGPLVRALHEIGRHVPTLRYLEDKYSDGSTGPLRDICPFTVMGSFNRGITAANRIFIATELARFLDVTVEVPSSFEGVPVLNNQRSWFFGYETQRGAGDIDALWRVFKAARKLPDEEPSAARDEFVDAYDAATRVWGVAWNLSTGLYWIRPSEFPTLDIQSRQYIETRLRLEVKPAAPQMPCNGSTYLQLASQLKTRFAEADYPVHSFPELSLASWQHGSGAVEVAPSTAPIASDTEPQHIDTSEAVVVQRQFVPYSVEDILADGCFLPREELEQLLERLRQKKNLILQGPPGTGKTWLAKRLAFALVGQVDEDAIRAVQFHPNLSYEDFVRGWWPTSEGKLALSEGVFMQVVDRAKRSPDSRFVVVIEEINRGNPAQVFGELLTLLEAGKRTPKEALQLCYPDPDGVPRPVHIPENLYVIGTMNIADRSLALVDLALRRRFAFVGLEPQLGAAWRRWVVGSCGVDESLVGDIERRMLQLNAEIAADARLGRQFRIGHSYVTPVHRLEPGATRAWFRQVVKTELGPLLEEYWFDAPEQARKATDGLLQGW